MPAETRETARPVVRDGRRGHRAARSPTRSARRSSGASTAPRVTRRPRHDDIDWDRTIRAQPAPLPARLPDDHPRDPARPRPQVSRRCATSSSPSTSPARWPRRSSTRGLRAPCWRSIRSVQTQLVVFDTAVVDLTDELDDPVEVLFGTQLGGGTDINRALGYCQALIARPAGHDPRADQRPLRGRRCEDELLKRVGALRRRGRDGDRACSRCTTTARRRYDHALAAELAGLGVPVVRLHARPVPRPDGRRDRAPRHRPLGRRPGHRRGAAGSGPD